MGLFYRDREGADVLANVAENAAADKEKAPELLRHGGRSVQ